MSRIYIAGPMRGIDQDNFPAFDEARTRLRRFGWDVVSPADMDRSYGYDPTIGDTECPFDWGSAIQRDVAAISRCTDIVLLPGWESSMGVAVEAAVAHGCGLTFYEYDPDPVDLADGLRFITAETVFDTQNAHRWRKRSQYMEDDDSDGIIRCGRDDVLPDGMTVAHVNTPEWQEIFDQFTLGRYGGHGHKLLEDSAGVTVDTGQVRTFATGAVRGTQQGKLDYEGYFTHRFFEGYGDYMERNSHLPDGTVRDSDNWQKGFPIESFVKSGWRHMVGWWKGHRTGKPDLDACYGVVFNAIGYIDQTLKEQGESNGS